MRWIASFLLLAVFALPQTALAGPAWVFERVALDDETAPGSSENYQAFDNAGTSGAEVAFAAMLTGFPPSWGIYRSDAGVVSAIATTGDTAPGAGVATYSVLLSFPSRRGDTVAFASTLLGGSVSLGLFVDDGSTVDPVVLFGDAAPGGATFEPNTGDFTVQSVNASGEVVFRSTLTGGSAAQGIFRGPALGPFDTIALLGDAAPSGGTLSDFGWPSQNASGDVAFRADTSGGSAAGGIYFDDGSLSSVVLLGDVAPGTGGAVFDMLAFPVLNDSGDVVFIANTVGGTALGGLFLAEAGGAVLPLIVDGQVLPGTGGEVLSAYGPNVPTLSNDGSSAFAASTASTNGVFVYDGPSAKLLPVVLAGAAAPDTGGATFTTFEYAGIDAAGAISFEATLSDGRNGIFTATRTTAVPVASPVGAAVLVLLLVAGATVQLARSENGRSRSGATR